MNPFNVTNIIIVILCLLIAFVVGLTFKIYFKHKEKQLFNKGSCIECQIPLERLGQHGKIRSYCCPKCHTIFVVYYNVDKNIQLKQYKFVEDEDEEIMDSIITS